MNRSVIGCVPVLGGGLLCPGVDRGRHFMHWPFCLGTAQGPNRQCCPGSGVPASALTAPGSIGLAPFRVQNRQCCPGSDVAASMLTASVSIGVARGTNPGAGLEPRGRRMIVVVKTGHLRSSRKHPLHLHIYVIYLYITHDNLLLWIGHPSLHSGQRKLSTRSTPTQIITTLKEIYIHVYIYAHCTMDLCNPPPPPSHMYTHKCIAPTHPPRPRKWIVCGCCKSPCLIPELLIYDNQVWMPFVLMCCK